MFYNSKSVSYVKFFSAAAKRSSHGNVTNPWRLNSRWNISMLADDVGVPVRGVTKGNTGKTKVLPNFSAQTSLFHALIVLQQNRNNQNVLENSHFSTSFSKYLYYNKFNQKAVFSQLLKQSW